MKKLVIFFITALFMVSFGVIAQDMQPLPEINLFETITSLITGWSGMTDLAKGSAVVLILTQAVKQFTDFEYKNLVAVFFSVAYAVLQMMVNGTGVSTAITTALFSMGGAVMIYNTLKPVLAKVPAINKYLNLGESNEVY